MGRPQQEQLRGTGVTGLCPHPLVLHAAAGSLDRTTVWPRPPARGEHAGRTPWGRAGMRPVRGERGHSDCGFRPLSSLRVQPRASRPIHPGVCVVTTLGHRQDTRRSQPYTVCCVSGRERCPERLRPRLTRSSPGLGPLRPPALPLSCVVLFTNSSTYR